MSDKSQLPFFKHREGDGDTRYFLRSGVQGADNLEISERQFEMLSDFAEGLEPHSGKSNVKYVSEADLVKPHQEQADKDFDIKPVSEPKDTSGYYDPGAEEIAAAAANIPDRETGPTAHSAKTVEVDTPEVEQPTEDSLASVASNEQKNIVTTDESEVSHEEAEQAMIENLYSGEPADTEVKDYATGIDPAAPIEEAAKPKTKAKSKTTDESNS